MTAVVVPAEVLFLAWLEPLEPPAFDAVPPAAVFPPPEHPDSAISTASAAGTRKVPGRFDMVEGLSVRRGRRRGQDPLRAAGRA
jgi:hypothetical protein